MNKIFHLGFVPVKKLGKSLLLKYGLMKIISDAVQVGELVLHQWPELPAGEITYWLLLQVLVQDLDLPAHVFEQEVADVVRELLVEREYLEGELVDLDALEVVLD